MPPPYRDFSRLHLENVRCFRNTDISFDPKVTVIVGGNASGKTTVIEALASLAFGEDEGLKDFPLRQETQRGEIALYESGRAAAVAKWNSTERRRHRLHNDRYMFLYGRYRGMPPVEPPREPLSDSQYLDELASHAAKSRADTVTHPDNRLLHDLVGYLRGIYSGRDSDPRLATLWSRMNTALSQLDSSLSAIRMDTGKYHVVPRIIRNGVPLELTRLSDGYQAILTIVLDLMLRYAYLFLGGDPLAGKALVGIDEIDLHLHPRWQRTVLPQLTALFPNTQFIVTTHSPIIVQAAIDQNGTVLRLAEKDGEVNAQRLSPTLMKALRGAEVGSLLLEDHLFGVESRFSVECSKIEQKVEELQSKVTNGEATRTDYKKLKSGLSKLEELAAKEDRRRADGSTMGQMVRMQGQFVKALTDELKRARR
jgi:energy-coupling factor transporter ATP-binding protein EcfA2